MLALVMGCAVLWSLESVVPLYVYEKNRLRRALPNISLTVLLVLTNLVLSFATVGVSNFVVNRKLGLLFLLPTLPTWLTALLGIMALDFFTYLAHLLMHKSWLGWQFHRVHHSDYEVNVTTAFRQHPGETVWRIFWYGLAVALFGISPFVLVLYLTISTLNAQLEHTNIKLRESVDRVLRILFVTPNIHKVHHSREQYQTDTNYSNIFSAWDRIFGTYTSTIDFSRLRYGLDGFDDRQKQTLPALLKLPFLVEA
ncbi:MAG TPA: sterol desaturase family protein [Pyrinomonadaceae bacterium]|nr:sterol desaturase family protein [Pyrinomonadaceae bacterium]